METPARNKRLPDLEKMAILKQEQYAHVDAAMKRLNKAQALIDRLAALEVETTAKIHTIQCKECIEKVAALSTALNGELQHLIEIKEKGQT